MQVTVRFDLNEREILKGLDSLVAALFHYNCGGTDSMHGWAMQYDDFPYNELYKLTNKHLTQFFVDSIRIKHNMAQPFADKTLDMCLDSGQSVTQVLEGIFTSHFSLSSKF